MKNNTLTFNQPVYRRDLIVFTPEYFENLQILRSMLSTGTQLRFFLGRLEGYEFTLGELYYYQIEAFDASKIEVSFVAKGTDFRTNKTIRLDNVLGEIPVLEGFAGQDMIKLNKGVSDYFKFIAEVRTQLRESIGNIVTLTYKNDDGSESIITTSVLEVNKGNFLCSDFRNIHCDQDGIISNDLSEIKKNHRFISQNSFLQRVHFSNLTKVPFSSHDDGYTFGKISKKEVTS